MEREQAMNQTKTADHSMTNTPSGVFDFELVRRSRRFLQNADRQGVVYFIGYGDGPVKIGFTTDLGQRVQSLQTGCPYTIEVLASFDGTPGHEWDYHERFKKERLRGEWFNRTPEILAEIARLNPTTGDEL